MARPGTSISRRADLLASRTVLPTSIGLVATTSVVAQVHLFIGRLRVADLEARPGKALFGPAGASGRCLRGSRTYATNFMLGEYYGLDLKILHQV